LKKKFFIRHISHLRSYFQNNFENKNRRTKNKFTMFLDSLERSRRNLSENQFEIKAYFIFQPPIHQSLAQSQYGTRMNPNGESQYGTRANPGGGEGQYGTRSNPNGEGQYGTRAVLGGEGQYGTRGILGGESQYGTRANPSGEGQYGTRASLGGEGQYGTASR
jgi:hypothetical protein